MSCYNNLRTTDRITTKCRVKQLGWSTFKSGLKFHPPIIIHFFSITAACSGLKVSGAKEKENVGDIWKQQLSCILPPILQTKFWILTKVTELETTWHETTSFEILLRKLQAGNLWRLASWTENKSSNKFVLFSDLAVSFFPFESKFAVEIPQKITEEWPKLNCDLHSFSSKHFDNTN